MNKDKLKKPRTERPDKIAFPTTLAILLLLGSISFGVIDYGSYKDYRRAVAHAEEIRQHPKTLAGSSYKPEFIIAMSEGDASRSRQQMLWVSAVMLLFLSIALFLLIRSVKTYRRIRNLQYEEIDWRALEKPPHRVEVLYGRIHPIAAVIFYIFFGGMSLLLLFDSFKASRTRIGGIFIGSFNLLLALALFYLLSKGKRKSIKSYDASGITRVDGQHFLWSDFRGAIARIGTYRYGGKGKWPNNVNLKVGDIVYQKS